MGLNLWPFGRKSEAALPARVEPDLGPSIQASSAATYPLSDPYAWEKLFGPRSESITPDLAMTQGVVYSCVSLIAGQIASLPIYSYTTTSGQQEIEKGTAAARILAQPNERYSRVVFWRSIVSSMLLNGNGVAWIERAPNGTPIALWSVPWGRAGVQFYTAPNGRRRLLYHLVLDDGVHVQAEQDDVLHIPGSVVWNMFYSVSPLTAYALSVDIAIQADKFAQAYFRNSTVPEGYISVPGALAGGAKQADEYREAIKRRFSGDLRFAGPAVLDQGAKWESLRINAADAQLIESRQFNAIDIARIFHVPPHLINVFDKVQAFGKGLEELNQGFLDYTLAPHLDAIEAEIRRKLYPASSDRYAEFDRDALMRGDLKSRNEGDMMALGGAQGPGWKSVNEVRLDRGLPKLAGDEFNRPLQWGAAAPQKPESGKAKPDPAAPAAPKGPSKKD